MNDLRGSSYTMGLYHILNRGVEQRDIFLDKGDRARFVHDLYEFNDVKPARNTTRIMNDLRGRPLETKRIVDLHGWVLMRNHYHLLVSERIEGGLTRFIMKLNVGYAKYFNEKYKRSGTLFQSRTKKVLIHSDAHFLHILHYIHLNPLDFLAGAKAWRTGEITDAKKALLHLESYRWSSYLDYCGKKNFPSILTTELFADVFGSYGKTLKAYMQEMEDGPSVLRTLKLE